MSEIPPGALKQRLQETVASALACGALQPIDTEMIRLHDAGIDFQIRWVSSLQRKASAGAGNARYNPFLQPEPELIVGALGVHHLALLNKFNVIDNHMLIVTRDFEQQEQLPTRQELGLLWRCLGEYPSLGFYNGGETAGASQRHKHLQLIPLPQEGVPIQALLDRGETLPFNHRLISMRDDCNEGTLFEQFVALLDSLGIGAREQAGTLWQSAPYNLLLTRRWMLVVARSRECFRGISINAMGFAGSLFVRDQEQIEWIRESGPLAVLRGVIR